MRRILGWIGITLILAAGGGLGLVYAIRVAVAADRGEVIQANGNLGGFGVALLAAGLIWLSITIRPRGRAWYTRLRFPPVWLGLLVFGLAIGAGFVMRLSETATAFAPLLAAVALAGVAIVIGRFVARWSPDNGVRADSVVRTAVWGMIGAPSLAVISQLLVLIVLVAGVMTGLALADRDLVSEVEHVLQDASGDPNSLDSGLLTTPTVAFALFSIVAVIAPLTEELFKGLGVIFVMTRRADVTRYRIFAAGVASGLGFALVEALGYSLATPDNWQTVMLVRAPVVIIHVAGTALVAMGWFMQQSQGGLHLLWYYAAAVLLHAAWNGLSVALLMTGAGIEDMANPGSARALTLLLLLVALGAVLLAALVWVVMAARSLARENDTAERSETGRPSILAGFEPGAGISYSR